MLVTGIGTEAAAQAMDLMMRMADEDQYFDICISSGLAGALQTGLAPGDIIAPQSLIVEYAGKRFGFRPVEGGRGITKASAGLPEQMLGLPVHHADRVLVKASQKQICASQAQSVDMESFRNRERSVCVGRTQRSVASDQRYRRGRSAHRFQP